MQRFENEAAFFLRQSFQVFCVHEMRLRHMSAQDLTLRGLYRQVFIPMREGEPFEQPFVAARCIGKGIRSDIDLASLVSAPQGCESLGLPEEIGRTVDDETDGLPLKEQALAVPSGVCGRGYLSLPAAAAEEITEQAELFSKSALLQGFGIIKNKK